MPWSEDIFDKAFAINWVCSTVDKLSLFTLGDVALPDTGFAPGAVSIESVAPANAFAASGGIVLDIPQLGLTTEIAGVPQAPGGWDVSWLGQQAGYLYGTAFPTWAGNTVLTGHVWNADDTPGIFYGLDQLQHGDRFYIQAWGLTYTYEVRSTYRTYDNNLSPLVHSDYDIVTLLTCESFSEWSGEYRYRRAVQAVLIAVD
jgi:LPXTG-site transpeptidase (sortase) family protein